MHNDPKRPPDAVFSGEFWTMVPHKKAELVDDKHQVVKDFGEHWTVEGFKLKSTKRDVVEIGAVDNKAEFVKPVKTRSLHLPIKLPKSDIRIPIEYKQFEEAIQKIVDFEYSNNPFYDDAYLYLSVDAGFVPKGKSQRIVFAHVDGIPRNRKTPGTTRTDHSYLITNSIPTKFFMQDFDMSSYDLNKHNFFEVMNRTAREESAVLTKPFAITLMGPYNVHTAIQNMDKDVQRVFMRIETSYLDFDRIGNSINPAFIGYTGYPFEYQHRPIPFQLVVPTELKTAEELRESGNTNFAQKHYGSAIGTARFDFPIDNLEQARSYIKGIAGQLDDDSRYITELFALMDASKDLGEFLNKLESARGHLWAKEAWQQMSVQEKIFTNLITTETESYRFEISQLTLLNDIVIPELLARNQKVEVLSLPSSIGLEAMSLTKMLEKEGFTQFKITGMDVMGPAVALAKKNLQAATPFYQERIRFAKGDAFDPMMSSRFGKFREFESPNIIISQSFLAYFKPDKISEVLQNYRKIMQPKGFLIVERYVLERYPEVFSKNGFAPLKHRGKMVPILRRVD